MEKFIIVMFALLVFVAIGISGGCKTYKRITDVQPVPLANIWGKDIKYVARFDDGSMTDYDYGVEIGKKECKEW